MNERMSGLSERLHRAVERLGERASDPSLGRLEAARLRGKIEGVKLALSYLDDHRGNEPVVSLPTGKGLDWQDMFRRYADIVGLQESVDFLAEYQWEPEEWAAIQALCGDAS